MRAVAIAPARDERGKIGRVVSSFPPGTVECVVVVDDGSTDGTGAEAQAAGATVLRHESSRGVGAAIRTGIEHAMAQGYDAVVVLGGDDQDDGAEARSLLQPICDGTADFVQGSRWASGGRTVDIPFTRRYLTQVYSLLFSAASGRRITDATNGFRAFRCSMLRDPRIDLHREWLDTYELEPYLLWSAIRLGYRVTEVPVTKRYHRDAGFTKMRPVTDWWRILRPIVLLRLGLRR